MRKLLIVFGGALLLAACLPLDAFQIQPQPGKEGWISMFDGKTLDGWKTADNPESWKVVDGMLVGDGPRSHLFWMVKEFDNCEFRAEVKLNHEGNSGMFFRAAFGPGFPKGYEAQVENTSSDPQKTGTLYGLARITAQLIQDDTWWTEHVIANGNHIIITVNDKVVVDYIDEKNTYTKGYLALQQHNAGSVVQYRNVMMRPLPPK
jgi:hypothetical protein